VKEVGELGEKKFHITINLTILIAIVLTIVLLPQAGHYADRVFNDPKITTIYQQILMALMAIYYVLLTLVAITFATFVRLEYLQSD